MGVLPPGARRARPRRVRLGARDYWSASTPGGRITFDGSGSGLAFGSRLTIASLTIGRPPSPSPWRTRGRCRASGCGKPARRRSRRPGTVLSVRSPCLQRRRLPGHGSPPPGRSLESSGMDASNWIALGALAVAILGFFGNRRFYLDPKYAKVSDSFADPAGPLEAEVTVPRPDCFSRRVWRVGARSMNAEILIAESVNEPVASLDDLRADDISVERVGPFPVRDGDYAVVDNDRSSHVAILAGPGRPLYLAASVPVRGSAATGRGALPAVAHQIALRRPRLRRAIDEPRDELSPPQRSPGCCAIRLARPVQGCGSVGGSRDEPQAASARQAWPRQHGFGITQLPPQFLVLQRHRDTLGVIDRSALIGGDRDPRHSHKRTSTRPSHAGRWVMIPPWPLRASQHE